MSDANSLWTREKAALTTAHCARSCPHYSTSRRTVTTTSQQNSEQCSQNEWCQTHLPRPSHFIYIHCVAPRVHRGFFGSVTWFLTQFGAVHLHGPSTTTDLLSLLRQFHDDKCNRLPAVSPTKRETSRRIKKTTHVFDSARSPVVNALEYKAILMLHWIVWSWYTDRWWVGCYIGYSEEVTGRGRSPPRPLLAVPNVTAHPSTASVPITVLPYNGPLRCGFNVVIKGLKWKIRGKGTVHRLWAPNS